jgi:RNA polymerase sigma-70 factor, ECF subfamily
MDTLVHDLYRKSGAADYELSEVEFAQILSEVAAAYLGHYSQVESSRLYETLHLEELALARACAAGMDKAWEVFLTRYREKLYEMAGAIARDETAARELADSLYAQLYGLNTHQEHRISKLAYYSGRGSLEGWLRTVLVQEFINRCRTQKRQVSLEEKEEQGQQFAAAESEPVQVTDPRVARATDDALAALPAEERFILAAYFLDGSTLATIGRMLNVHESTISRKIDKLTRNLRAVIMKRLMTEGLDRRAAEEAMEVDVRDLSVDVRLRLAQETAGAAFHREESG